MKIYKSYAKVNIFLKIIGKRGDYHEIISRFMRVDNLYDELSFTPKNNPEFNIIGNFSCRVEKNTIYRAYQALLKATSSPSLEKLMITHSVTVNKSIPAFAGLGGGSSNAATYLKMCNEVLHLGLSRDELVKIGLEVGADVAFFIYDYSSANVSGIGEIVEEFIESPLHVEIKTPNIEICTPTVYRKYREEFFAPIDTQERVRLEHLNSIDVISSMDIYEANDLFVPALKCYKDLAKHQKDGWFFSGSGSSFFRVVDAI